MAIRRWSLGSYPFKYNPHSDERKYGATEKEVISVTGAISNPNEFFEKEISIEFDLYDKPTYYERSTVSKFMPNKYVGISEKRVTGELFCLRLGTVDVMSSNGSNVSKRDYSFAGTPISIAHMDDRLALLIRDTATTGSLYITDENCNQISKYTITDNDYLDSLSMSWDLGAQVYVLNKYGKIFNINVNTGASRLLVQYDDFIANKSNGEAKYNSLHHYLGFLGFVNSGRLTYTDSNLGAIYGNDIPPIRIDGAAERIVGMSYGNFTGSFHILLETGIKKAYPNVCGVDIERIRKEISNGIVLVTDDKKNSFYIIVKDMQTTRNRNKQDARYVVSINGTIM